MDTSLQELWARKSDEEVREAVAQLWSFENAAAAVIVDEARRRGILDQSAPVTPKAGCTQQQPGLLQKLFTKRNLTVGWSSAWLGLVAGVPLTMFVDAAYGLSSKYPILVLPCLVALAAAFVWSWRRIQHEGMLMRTILALLAASWITICPLNLTFSFSSRRAVRRYRGIDVGPLRYLPAFAGFAIVLAGIWLVIGLPLGTLLGVLLDRMGKPGSIQWSLFGLWLLVFPLPGVFLFGYLVNDIADRSEPADDAT
jgi:hypothetical protein